MYSRPRCPNVMCSLLDPIEVVITFFVGLFFLITADGSYFSEMLNVGKETQSTFFWFAC